MKASEFSQLLADAGVSPAAIEEAVKVTASIRHQERIYAAKAAAGIEGSPEQALRLFAEAFGCAGGGCKNPGAGTSRLPWAAGLGKGRRLASDGGAWNAAIMAAAREGRMAFSCIENGQPALVSERAGEVFSRPATAGWISETLGSWEAAAVLLRREILRSYQNDHHDLMVALAKTLGEVLLEQAGKEETEIETPPEA